jgi:hypothetical protein
VHDREASRVPWEVLRVGSTHPALAGGLSRRYTSDALSVARWREDRATADTLRVLLIVNPTQDLPGAAAEGSALQQQLARRSVTCDVLAGRDATRSRIVTALSSGAFDILHFAGHAFFDARRPDTSGLLCAGKEVLRAEHLASLGALPALIFCNACEAARVRRKPATRRSTTVHSMTLLDGDGAFDTGANAGDHNFFKLAFGGRRGLRLHHAWHAERNRDRERKRGATGRMNDRTETVSGARDARLQMLGHLSPLD